ncbi:glycerophosphoryl diester phosphodiesterase membrane domain-containing protein [Qipengyuania sp. CAU 1752]
MTQAPERRTKFDMTSAWEQGVAMLRANSSVVSVIAGVFFFLPLAALLYLLPDLSNDPAFAGNAGNPEAMTKAITAVMAETWWMILIVIVSQSIGQLALYRLLNDRSRPTVAEALKFGAVAFLPYIGAMILAEVVRLVVVGIPTTLAGTVGLGAVFALIGLVATIYLYVKFSLIAPVVGIAKELNPFSVLLRSWKLTRHNSLRLFLFYFLLVVAFAVLWLVATLVMTLVFGLMGPGVAGFGFILSTAVAMSAFWCVYLAVLSAIFHQLGGVSETVAQA